MNILVDTHIALWALSNTKRLTEKMKDVFEEKDHRFYYSIVSVWEVSIKYGLHREDFTIPEEEFENLCLEAGFHKLDLTSKHIYGIKALVYPDDAPRHNDPFDRLLLSQAITEQIKFMTADEKIPYYKQDCVIKV